MFRPKSEPELRELLVSGGIDVNSWGMGTAKSVRDLWNEICEGDASIEIEPLVRLVSVVEVEIRKGDYVLKEAEQELRDGRRRVRNMLPSEKMRRGEDAVAAAVRCMSQEFGINGRDVDVIRSSAKPRESIQDSPSYPGLKSRYTIYKIEVEVRGLPEEEFWTEEAESGRLDPVRRHRWVWATGTTLNSNSGLTKSE